MGFFRAFADRHGIRSAGSGDMVKKSTAVLREASSGIVVGGMLGAAHAMLPLGLDFKGRAPIDAGVATAGLALAAYTGSKDAAAIGTAAATVFSFRKFYAFAAAKKAADATRPPEQRLAGDRVQEQNVLLSKQQKPGLAAHGDFGADTGAEDRIIEAARAL